jgi:aryl-alcohol dehydrogenase-like predicted oxidoreductase
VLPQWPLGNFKKISNVVERNGWAKFAIMQNLYNLVYRKEKKRNDWLLSKYCIGITPWSPFNAGHPLERTKTLKARYTPSLLKLFMIQWLWPGI